MKIKYTTGYAGTGKSTQLLQLLETIPEDTALVLGPTHKALERLRQEYKGAVELKTIHSLLGLIPRINESAKHVGQLHTLHKLDKDIEEYENIVIDEAGMINELTENPCYEKFEVRNHYGQRQVFFRESLLQTAVY